MYPVGQRKYWCRVCHRSVALARAGILYMGRASVTLFTATPHCWPDPRGGPAHHGTRWVRSRRATREGCCSPDHNAANMHEPSPLGSFWPPPPPPFFRSPIMFVSRIFTQCSLVKDPQGVQGPGESIRHSCSLISLLPGWGRFHHGQTWCLVGGGGTGFALALPLSISNSTQLTMSVFKIFKQWVLSPSQIS